MRGILMEWVALRKTIVILFLLVLIFSMAGMHGKSISTGFASGDRFDYHEVQTLANGTGSYSGYTDQTTITGGETMEGISGSTVSANYTYSYAYSDNQGSSTTSSIGGSYTWSDSSFQYVSGTDNEVGYVNPTVWFTMNSALPVGGTFVSLSTQMTVMSKNYTLYLLTENMSVTTIFAQGSGSYIGSPQNNAYGNFSAKYTWNEYFDPTTGYIVGYHYVEQDTSTNGNGTGFGYSDNLYVTSTSYPLAVISTSSQGISSQSFTTSLSTSSTSSSSSTTSSPAVSTSLSSSAAPTTLSGEDLGIIALVAIVLIAVVAVTAISRRRKTSEDTSTGTQS